MAVLQVHYLSTVLEQRRRAILIVPETAPPPYAVLFQLHGLSDDESMWLRRTRIEAYAADQSLLVVMPDAGRSYYADAVEGQAMGTAIGVELPALIERWFPTRPGWAIGGLSMGGYGAIRLAMTYPDRFVSVAAHSSSLGVGHFYGWGDDPFGREFRACLGRIRSADRTICGPWRSEFSSGRNYGSTAVSMTSPCPRTERFTST